MQHFSALSDPTRQRIVEMLTGGPLTAGEIAGQFPLSPQGISQHLKKLREARLVRVRPVAQQRIYELDPDGVAELSDWIGRIRSFWSAKLDTLEDVLAKEN
ncbi:MAG TPA: metalloregulator ArsR/SmtB family transcription factor [Rhizomicrobium sp.]|jgi:DNA-binding transcriptional ArsR family regulator|nr:metalloregulator ArsR/SmtB family transcription factor [Rhizomicrobium sp.]